MKSLGESILQDVFKKEAALHYKESLQELLWGEFYEISADFDLTKMQDSWSWRNAYVARQLSERLLDDKGEINKSDLVKAIHLLEEGLYCLGPDRHHDERRQKHLLKILKLFHEKSELPVLLKRIHKPYNHVLAENLIRETLFLGTFVPLQDGHARKAAFSALLCFLRQNVGSCFATAPAILVEQDLPEKFLNDMGELFGKGRLVRVVSGIEHAAPLSFNSGVGDFFRPFFLQTLGENPLERLARSPGLQEGFLRASLINPDLSALEKRGECFRLLKEAVIFSENELLLPISASDIFKKVLLKHFDVSLEDVLNYKEKPPISGSLTPFAPQGQKRDRVSRYLKAYGEAKKAFVALTENALLKAWEFTLASFAESKAEFAKWNLFISLGMDPKEPHGIGRAIYEKIQQNIEGLNEEIKDFESHYEHLFVQAKYVEGRIRAAKSESELGWLRAEYEMRRSEINRALAMRESAYEKGRKLQNLFSFLFEFYGEKIRDFFQEVYDAEMQDVQNNPYDDSPAGFRLMYKHGRANTSLWTMIENAAEYLQYLSAFFIQVENELKNRDEIQGLESEISDFVTTILTTIRREDFLESSFFRLARAYNEKIIQGPLNHLDQVKRKPWAYISGGTIETLISAYFTKEEKLKEAKRWVESETELLAFFIDTMKELPLSIQRLYQTDSDLSMLSFSPTHAFLLKPGLISFRKAWENDLYTYTWIRDTWVFPALRFLDENILNARMIETLISELLLLIPPGYRSIIKNSLKNLSSSMHPSEFRENVLKALSYQKWLKEIGALNLISEEIDSLLYQRLPFFTEQKLKENLNLIFSQIAEIDLPLLATIFQFYPQIEEEIGKYKILSSNDLMNIAKTLLIMATKKTRSRFSFHEKILESMQKNKLAYPQPILVADTNWIKSFFGFVVSPGSSKVEFWRFDKSGFFGKPISQWKNFLNGKDKQDWGIYTNPNQYHIF